MGIKNLLSLNTNMRLLVLIFMFLTNIFEVHACEMSDTSAVYFKMLSTETFLPVTKKDFQGGKVVVKNDYLKNC